VLSAGKIDSCDAGHLVLLALPLLVAGVFADHADDALTAHDLALVTDFLDARANFHFSSNPSEKVRLHCAGSEAYL
jgi:hypothetical protein